MDFRIADTFTDSLSRLNGDEQKAAKTTAFESASHCQIPRKGVGADDLYVEITTC